MTSNNETLSRQTPWAGNIAKTMTSNGKQFTVIREMLTAVARNQSVQLKVAWCCRKNLTAFFKICFCFVLLYNNHLMTGPWETANFVSLVSQCFPRISLRFSGNKIHSSPRDQSLSVYCFISIKKKQKKTSDQFGRHLSSMSSGAGVSKCTNRACIYCFYARCFHSFVSKWKMDLRCPFPDIDHVTIFNREFFRHIHPLIRS